MWQGVCNSGVMVQQGKERVAVNANSSLWPLLVSAALQQKTVLPALQPQLCCPAMQQVSCRFVLQRRCMGPMQGVLRVRTAGFGGSWVPVFVSAQQRKNTELYWPVSLSLATLNCIVCKSSQPEPQVRPCNNCWPVTKALIAV